LAAARLAAARLAAGPAAPAAAASPAFAPAAWSLEESLVPITPAGMTAAGIVPGHR
jgi:hypothetical protein